MSRALLQLPEVRGMHAHAVSFSWRLPRKLKRRLVVQAARSEKLAALQALEAELKAMQAEIAQYADSDPKKLEAMRAPGPPCSEIHPSTYCCMPGGCTCCQGQNF